MNPVEGIETPRQPEAGPSKPKRRFVGSTKPRPAGSSIRRIVNQIPDDILNDSRLNAAIARKDFFHTDPHRIVLEVEDAETLTRASEEL